jgi:MFS family permease
VTFQSKPEFTPLEPAYDRSTETERAIIAPLRVVATCGATARQWVQDLAQNWRLIMCVFLPFAAGFYLSYLFRTINALIAAPLMSDLALGAGDFGLITSAYFLAFAAAQLPVGILLDRYGPRRVQSALMLVAAGGAALFALSNGFLSLLASRALIGLGVAAALAAALKAIILWFPKERLPLANGWMVALGALGAVTATGPAEFLLAWMDWRGLFELFAMLTLGCAITTYFIVPESSSSTGLSRKSELGLRAVYTDARFWRLAPLSATFIGTAWALQGLWAAAWLTDVEGFERSALVRHLLVMAIAVCLGALLIGVAADRLRRFGIGPQTLLALVAAIFIVAQGALILRCLSSSYVLWAVIAAVGAAPVLSYALLAEYFPKEMAGRANAALNVFHMGGAFVIQCGTGIVIAAWAKQNGIYPEIAFQVAFSLNVALQIGALAWFAWPRLRIFLSVAVVHLGKRLKTVSDRADPIVRRLRMRAGHACMENPQAPFMRCLACGSIRTFENQAPIVATQ